jgi:hypothetical protein
MAMNETRKEKAYLERLTLEFPLIESNIKEFRDTLVQLDNLGKRESPWGMALEAFLGRYELIEQFTPEDWERLSDSDAEDLLQEFSELGACLFKPRNGITRKSPEQMGQAMIDVGIQFLDANTIVNTTDHGKAGRPWSIEPTKLLDAAQLRWEGKKLAEITAMPEFSDDSVNYAQNFGRSLSSFTKRLKEIFLGEVPQKPHSPR